MQKLAQFENNYSIELLKEMLALYFEHDPDGAYPEGLRYVGSMPTILRYFVNIEITLNENLIKTKLFINTGYLEREDPDLKLKQEYVGDYPLIAEIVIPWEKFKFTDLTSWIAKEGQRDF